MRCLEKGNNGLYCTSERLIVRKRNFISFLTFFRMWQDNATLVDIGSSTKLMSGRGRALVLFDSRWWCMSVQLEAAAGRGALEGPALSVFPAPRGSVSGLDDPARATRLLPGRGTSLHDGPEHQLHVPLLLKPHTLRVLCCSESW